MKEAFGGIFNFVFLAIFLVIAIGLLGFTFSYAKAFKMKNAIIATIEEYEGNLGHSGCQAKIKNEAKSLGYNKISKSCPSDFSVSPDGFYCYSSVTRNIPDTNPQMKSRYYTVVVQVDIGLPLIKNIVGFSVLEVSGDTKEIVLR
ncbi:MAG: hypothetical protein IKF71_03140 [Bacilli bacterium]|nr:hypothetical protein [Bacilli bacterium]